MYKLFEKLRIRIIVSKSTQHRYLQPQLLPNEEKTGASRERDECDNGEYFLDVDDFEVCFTPILTRPESVAGILEKGRVRRGIYRHDCQRLEVALDSHLKKELNFAVVECIVKRELEEWLSK
jgi:hypothetical protein